MGMESYFFSLNMETILQPANILDFFQRRYKVRSYDTIRRKKQLLTENERFSLDNRVVIEMTRVQKRILLTFGDCFHFFISGICATYCTLSSMVLSRVMRKYNSVTYEVGKAKAEQAAGMFGLTADQRTDSCPSRVAKPLAKPLTGGWRSATYARSQQSAPRFSRSICSSDFMLM